MSFAKDKSVVSTALTLTVFALPILAQIYFHRRENVKDQARRRQWRQSFTQHKSKTWYRPPFPPIVLALLVRCRLAYLSTVDTDNDSSHLSLMRYPYIPEEEVIVMSTNMKTKKFSMLKKQTGVAILVHDFTQFGSGENGVCSITLNGKCYIVSDGPDAERYRAAHLEANKDYPQFIVGEDVAMLVVEVEEARICDINDKVTKWNVDSGLEGSV